MQGFFRRSQENRAYPLLVDHGEHYVYCHMTDDLDSYGGGGCTQKGTLFLVTLTLDPHIRFRRKIWHFTF